MSEDIKIIYKNRPKVNYLRQDNNIENNSKIKEFFNQ